MPCHRRRVFVILITLHCLANGQTQNVFVVAFAVKVTGDRNGQRRKRRIVVNASNEHTHMQVPWLTAYLTQCILNCFV